MTRSSQTKQILLDLYLMRKALLPLPTNFDESSSSQMQGYSGLTALRTNLSKMAGKMSFLDGTSY